MAKIFADECINYDLVLALRKAGFDVLTVKEVKLIGCDDETIYNFAQTNRRILLTFDRGFGDIFRFDIVKSYGVIIVLISRIDRKNIADIIIKFLNGFKTRKLRGKLVIIAGNKIRISQR
ncbi:MAG TPA: hypothetical protein ENL05_01315 [Candidatus Moranbacteria bacterium]|nr:hypothetical protein [Candidatus Moranbacteria bacterium]